MAAGATSVGRSGVFIKPSKYGGSDPKKLDHAREFDRVAALIQRYADEYWDRSKPGIFTIHSINLSMALRAPLETVELVVRDTNGSRNGFEICKPDVKGSMPYDAEFDAQAEGR